DNVYDVTVADHPTFKGRLMKDFLLDTLSAASSNGVSAVGPSVFTARLDFTNSTNDFTAAGPLVSVAELNFTNSTNDFSAGGPSNAAMPNLKDLSHN
nr:hypothetical protein [Tanacetum cinerariifolium]